MKLAIDLVPILDDNYVFVMTHPGKNEACLVDPGESALCLQFLAGRNLKMTQILLTHHHADHIDGVAGLKEVFPDAEIYAPLKNKQQIGKANHWVQQGDLVDFGFGKFRVIELPGHTMGHIAYHHAAEGLLFSGDVLFGLGCGRLFEGTPETAYRSLQKIKALPPETNIFCTHEYTAVNLQFVRQRIQKNEMPEAFAAQAFEKHAAQIKSRREAGRPTVPLLLENELAFNPFLLAKDAPEFTHLRQLRNQFRPK